MYVLPCNEKLLISQGRSMIILVNLFGVAYGTEITHISFNDSDSLMIRHYF